jgi:hypothetical protein
LFVVLVSQILDRGADFELPLCGGVRARSSIFTSNGAKRIDK